MTQQTFITTTTFIPGPGVTSVLVQATGPGGNGGVSNKNARGGGGGAGGEFAQDTVAVTPGNSYTVTIGTGGSAASSVFIGDNITVTAHGGANAVGTSGTVETTGSTNTVHFNGGAGSGGVSGASAAGGGGGGSAGSTSAGGDASLATAGTAGTGSPAGAVGATGGAALVPGSNGNAPGSGASGGGSGGTVSHGGGTGADGQIILTYTAVITSPTTIPVNNLVITPLDINGSRFTRQNPANYPNTYIQGITAADTVTANTSTPTVNRTGLVSTVTDRAFFGNVVIQPNYTFQAPFPVSLPYPLNLTLGPYRVQPRFNTNIAVPTQAVFGLTANDNVSAPTGGTQIITVGVYSLQFPSANNLPYPLNIIYRNLKPNIQGQPSTSVSLSNTNVSAVAPFGTVSISAHIVSNVAVAAKFGGLFIQGKIQPVFPFTNFPLPLKLRNLRPVYSSGKIQFPTVIFGITANESVSSTIGTVEIGKHIPGFVSNNFAASVPGTISVSVPENASAVNAVPHAPSAKITFAGTLSTSASAAHSGIVSIRELGITSNVNANPEFGSVHIGHSVLGITATITVASAIGSPKISISEHVNVSAASSVHVSVSKTGNVSAESASSRFGTINIFKSLHSNVAVASTVGIKISPALTPAKVSVKASARTTISVPVSRSQVTSSSVAGTRTTIGETARVSVSSPVGVTKVIIPAHVSGVIAVAPNEGKVVSGITSSVTATAHIGSAIIKYSNTARTSVNAYLGEAGTSYIDARIIARLNNFQGF